MLIIFASESARRENKKRVPPLAVPISKTVFGFNFFTNSASETISDITWAGAISPANLSKTKSTRAPTSASLGSRCLILYFAYGISILLIFSLIILADFFSNVFILCQSFFNLNFQIKYFFYPFAPRLSKCYGFFFIFKQINNFFG